MTEPCEIVQLVCRCGETVSCVLEEARCCFECPHCGWSGEVPVERRIIDLDGVYE